MCRELELLVDGKEAFPEIIKCINQSKKSIHINMFVWRDDHIGNLIGRAILNAAKRGVNIYISKDKYGNVLERFEENKKSFFHQGLTFIEKLQMKILSYGYPNLGVKESVKDELSPLSKEILCHPNITVQKDTIKKDHSKYYIFDDEIIIMGGINIEDKENGSDINGIVYQDYMIKLNGTKYVQALKEKLKTGKNRLSEVKFGINSKLIKPNFFEIEKLYIDLIKNAKKELLIVMPYFSPIRKVIKEIMKAYKRKIKITVIIPEKANFQNDLNKKTIKKLLKKTNNRIIIYESPKMIHSKIILNEELITIGSANIQRNSFSKLDELNVFIKNNQSEICKKLNKSIRETVQEANLITDYKEVKYRVYNAFVESLTV